MGPWVPHMPTLDVNSTDRSYIRTWEGRMEPVSSLIFSQMSVDLGELATHELVIHFSSRVNGLPVTLIYFDI